LAFPLTFWEVLFTFSIASLRVSDKESIFFMVSPMDFMVVCMTVLFFTISTAPIGIPSESYTPALDTKE
jgi:hypothetical protein